MNHLKTYKLFESIGAKWYHGTNSNFDKFNEPTGNGSRSLGIWATDDQGLAEMFGDNVLEVELDYKNPFTITTEKWNRIRDNHATDTSYFIKWREQLIKDGYDALFISEEVFKASSGTEFKDPNQVAVFFAKQIRIA